MSIQICGHQNNTVFAIVIIIKTLANTDIFNLHIGIHHTDIESVLEEVFEEVQNVRFMKRDSNTFVGQRMQPGILHPLLCFIKPVKK